MDSSVGDLDRISALPDDLLHRILAAVGDAVAVTRTAVLSKRWRRVWMHSQRLIFLEKEVIRGGTEPGRFEDFVDWVLAQRGDVNIGSLDIKYDVYRAPGATASTTQQLEYISSHPLERINQWLRYATQCVDKSLNIHLPYGAACMQHQENDGPAVEMPGHGKMSSIIMRLGCYRLQLPMVGTAKYEALTELTLRSASFDQEELDGVRSLGDFVSLCCPRLRKLDIEHPKGMSQLVLRNEALEELNLHFTLDMPTLDVTAPNLRVIKLVNCIDVSVVKVSANRLEEIGVGVHLSAEGDVELDIQADLTSVRCLGPIGIYMHGQHYGPDRYGGLWLLENCPGAEHVKVSLEHWEANNVTDVELIDLISSDSAPLTFTSVRRMEVTARAQQFPEGHLIASMSSLLLRFPHLTSLCINIYPSACWPFFSWRWDCLCTRLDTWTGPQEISLGSLEKVNISDFIGADEEIDLVSLLFASSKSMKVMTFLTSYATANTNSTISLKHMLEQDNNSTEPVDQKLTNIPSTNRGHWHFGKHVYTWVLERMQDATPVSVEGYSASPTEN